MAESRGFAFVDWDTLATVDAVSIALAENVRKGLLGCGLAPGEYARMDLVFENIGGGLYHVTMHDYHEGRTMDLGEGLYELDPAERPGWSELEQMLDDLSLRVDTGELDLGGELMEYYGIGKTA